MADASVSYAKFVRQRMSLRHLRLILVLEEERSSTKAAARLCISQAAVSKMRAEIESGVGRALFERSGRDMEMTPFGKCMAISARRIVAEIECMTEELTLLDTGMRGVLRIGLRTISGQPFLAKAIAQFKQAHPRLTIQLFDSDLPALLDKLAKGTISHLCARYDPTFMGANVDGHTILSDRSIVVASPGHPLVGKPNLSWQELVGCAWCLPPEGYAGRYAREYLAAQLVQHHVPFPTDIVEAQSSMMLLVNLLQSGNFLTVIPNGVAEELESLGLARPLDIEPVGPSEPLRLMWRADTALSPAARRFRDFTIALLRLQDTQAPAGGLLNEAQRFAAAGRAVKKDAANPVAMRRSGKKMLRRR